MIDDQMECVDAPVSITEKQMGKLVEEARKIEDIMGDPECNTRDCEKETLTYRRDS